ncbi:MAG: hypothetical protein OCD01_02215 [Fibrobacterales bacterium]
MGEVRPLSPALGEIVSDTFLTVEWSGVEASAIVLLLDTVNPPVVRKRAYEGNASVKNIEWGKSYYWQVEEW